LREVSEGVVADTYFFRHFIDFFGSFDTITATITAVIGTGSSIDPFEQDR